MASYSRDEARDWAREHLRGVINVIIPSFTSDSPGSTRQPSGTTCESSSSTASTGRCCLRGRDHPARYREFCEIAADEAKGGQIFFHHSSWSDLEHALAALRIAEDTGAEIVLLCYPPNFYPESEHDVYAYTKAICDATDLGRDAVPDVSVGLLASHPPVGHPCERDPSAARRLPEHRRDQGRGRVSRASWA